MFSELSTSPAVGIGDGTLIIQWTCRLRRDGEDVPFNLLPVAAHWDGGMLVVVVVTPHGDALVYPVVDLQFNPRGPK